MRERPTSHGAANNTSALRHCTRRHPFAFATAFRQIGCVCVTRKWTDEADVRGRCLYLCKCSICRLEIRVLFSVFCRWYCTLTNIPHKHLLCRLPNTHNVLRNLLLSVCWYGINTSCCLKAKRFSTAAFGEPKAGYATFVCMCHDYTQPKGCRGTTWRLYKSFIAFIIIYYYCSCRKLWQSNINCMVVIVK